MRRPLLIGAGILFVALYLVCTKALELPLEGSASNWIEVFGFTLIDLFAAALILECIHTGSALRKLLSWKPLQELGMISYGFYVYHDLLHDFYSDWAHRLSAEYPYPLTLDNRVLCHSADCDAQLSPFGEAAVAFEGSLRRAGTYGTDGLGPRLQEVAAIRSSPAGRPGAT